MVVDKEGQTRGTRPALQAMLGLSSLLRGEQKGYREGIERGTREERDGALWEFNRFLEEEVSDSVQGRVSGF